MVETTVKAPAPARKMRPETQRSRIGRPFEKGNAGKKKGTLARRTIAGIETARALSGRAFDRLAALVDSRSHRIAFEASRLVLAYAWGAPRQTVEVSGGISDLAGELTRALAAARLRRAQLDAALPVAGLLTQPEALPAGAEIVVNVPVESPGDMPVDVPVMDGAGNVKGQVTP